jgi:hypothetical protein
MTTLDDIIKVVTEMRDEEHGVYLVDKATGHSGTYLKETKIDDLTTLVGLRVDIVQVSVWYSLQHGLLHKIYLKVVGENKSGQAGGKG